MVNQSQNPQKNFNLQDAGFGENQRANVSIFVNREDANEPEENFDIQKKIRLEKKRMKDDLFKGTFSDIQIVDNDAFGISIYIIHIPQN